MVSISPKDFIDVSVRYEYFYYFLTDAHKQMVKNTAEEMMHYIDKSNQQFFDTYIPNHQHGLLSVGVTLRVNRLLNLHTFKFFDKKIKSWMLKILFMIDRMILALHRCLRYNDDNTKERCKNIGTIWNE